ncbi:MAG: BatA and WFA domain-containing protein, partial [Candidatus Cloacimonetes bacterium]|nr:BatA and WFA domain-containing protein [Candidatus Cloacimonadota bacterium]
MFQLSFLNTGLLIFAAATILPLIIWLLAKKKPPQIIFSTIRFIRNTEKEQKSRTQLKNILLLIIRMLIILLIVLAASRPSLRIPNLKPAQKHPPTAFAIILDTSYSMDYTAVSKSTLDIAKSYIQEINKRLNPQDLVVLITSDESWNRLNSQLLSGNISDNLLNSIRPTWLP